MKNIFIAFALAFLLACGGGSSNTSLEPPPVDNGQPQMSFNPDYDNLKAYIDTGTYADTIVNCVAIEDLSDACDLNTLAPIGLNNESPTVNDIMQHVTVSHDWMGVRMQELLEAMPQDIRQLLRPVTAIVIDDDIRPSYYTSLTGAIYIDPQYLWQTNAEKATISQKEDFRSGFGDSLQFKRLWRFIKDNEYAWSSFPLDGTEERGLEDTLLRTAYLFYHELAHANDCFYPARFESAALDGTVNDEVMDALGQGACINQQLTASAPLQSQTWKDLAQVLYHGETASQEQEAMTPADVAAAFASDTANDTYSYSTNWEDTAMAFDALMMKANFDIDRDIAFVDYYEEFSCDSAIINWGQRNRLSDPGVLARVQFVTSLMFPERDFSEVYDSLASPQEMPLGNSWCETALNSVTTQKTFTKTQQKQAAEHTLEEIHPPRTLRLR